MPAFNSLTLDTYFNKIFYINLQRDTERKEHMINQFKRFGIANYERIEAIQLTELPEPDLYRNFIKNDYKYLLGSLSCRESHLKCIKTAKQRGFERVLILEDDILFLQDPNDLLTQNHYSLSDWDMLYFGGLVEPHFRNQIVGAFAYAVSSRLYDNIINMAVSSGMEIDNFYAKILQHMSFNYNPSGKYNIKMIFPFNQVAHNYSFNSNIQK